MILFTPFCSAMRQCPQTLFRVAAVLCLSAMACFFSANAAEAAPAPKSSTRITSEKVTYDTNKNQVVFEGKVHVIRPTMEIWSDALTVLLDDSGKKNTQQQNSNALGVGGGKVEKIIAERNVRIKQENKLGTCGKATYFVNEGRIDMENNPVIVDGDNRISGKVITYYTETGRSVVTSDPQKPVVVEFTTDNNKGPALPGVPAAPDAPAPANGARQ